MSDAFCQNAKGYYDRLCEYPRIKVVRRNEVDSQKLYQNQTDQFHDNLNGGWAKPLTHYSINKFQLEQLPRFRDPVDSPLELDPSDTPELNKSRVIDRDKVEQFLNITPTPQIDGIHSLTEVVKPQTKYPFDFQLPTKDTDIKCLLTLEMKYFKVSDLQPGDKCSGFVQIYDFSTYTPLSEPLYFTFDENSLKLTQTDQRVIYIPIRNLNLNLTLACFILRRPIGSPAYNLFACNYSTLFDKDRNLNTDIKFSQNWYRISNCRDVQSMFTLDDTVENNLVTVDSKIEVLAIKDINTIREMKFTYSWKGKSNLPFSLLPLYPLADVPSPVGSIFNLHFVLNNPPSGSDIYMKIFAINESGEIDIKDLEFKAKKLSIFPLDNSETQDTFISSATPTSNEYSTPECIRVFVNNEVTENTILVIYLMSRQTKKGKIKDEVYKVGILPLKNEDANLQTIQRIPLLDFKGFPKKYLSQPKKMNNKTYLQYTVALPPVFFPTPFCKTFFNADEDNVPEFPQDMNIHLRSVIIPIVAKLLSIRSRKIINRLITLLEMFKDSTISAETSQSILPVTAQLSKKEKKEKKDKNMNMPSLESTSSLSFVFNGALEKNKYVELLSYWLYTSLDSLVCKPDFFCEALDEYIDEHVLNIACNREKYENAHEMIHMLNGGNLDLNTTKLISTSNNLTDTKPPDSKKETKKEKKQNLELQQKIVDELKKSIDALNKVKENFNILLDIVAVSISHYIKQNKKILKDDFIPKSQPIVKFFKGFGRFLNEMDYIETPHSVIIKMAQKFAQVLYMVQTFFSPKELSEIIFQVFYDTSTNVDDKGRTKQVSLKAQLLIFQSLTYTPNLFVAASTNTSELNVQKPFSPFNKTYGQIFRMADNIFQYEANELDTEEIMTLFCGNLSVLTNQLEDAIIDAKVKSHICYFLLPFIIRMPSYYNQLAEVPGLQSMIIPFILFVLNNCDPKVLFKFYHSLSNFDQTKFVEFLQSITHVSLKTETTGKFNYVKQITQRILSVLLHLVDGLSYSIVPTVQLTKLLLFENQFQTPLNYPHFYNFLSQLMLKQKANNELISLLIKNCSAETHSLRCLCASLLSWQMNADYKRNKDIILSSIDMLDSLTAILLSGNPEKIAIYKDLIKLIDDLAPRYNDDHFTDMLRKRMKTASIIADVVEEQRRSKQPPEIRCQQSMRVADEYRLLPSMRIQWLQRILTINKEEGNYVSAFVTQLHIVALIATIYDYKRRIELKKAGMGTIFQPRNNIKGKNLPLDNENANQSTESQVLPDPPFHLMIVRPIENAYPKYQYVHSQSYLDFEFFPEAAKETEIKFDDFQKGAWELIQNYDFKYLQREIGNAFLLGMKAELYYSLRPLTSLVMRIFYTRRNYEGLSRACDSLQKTLLKISYESCALIHDVNLQFYLVEMKTDNGELYKQVYCAKIGEKSPRADYEKDIQIQIGASASSSQISTSVVKPIETNHYSKADDGYVLEFGPDVNKTDRNFISLIHSKERFGERILKFCTKHDPDHCFDEDEKKVCVIRLEPTENIPVDDEDPHCWTNFQTRITRKLIEKTEGDTISLVVLETVDPLPHYKMTVDVKSFQVVNRSKVDVVNDIALYSAAVLDVISENLEAYFEYENAETWNITTDEIYNFEFVDKLHIVQSVLGMNEKDLTEDDDSSILGLLTALKFNGFDKQAKKIVQEIIQPSLKRALMIFLRGKKELESMKNYIDNVDKTFQIANEFLSNFEAELLNDDECYMSTTNTVWQKFRFEKDINY